jgi:Secretion system C-terminal sorting domain
LIANNYSSNGALYESSPNMKVFNNIIVNNYSEGVFHGHQRSSSIYVNNTICNNGAQGFVSASTTVNLSNNILRNNSRLVRDDSFNVSSILQAWPQTRNNNIERMASQLRGNGNIDLPTLFERPTTVAGIGEKGYEADWRLKQGSPEIDAGTTANGLLDIVGNKDFLGNPRVVGAAIDIGAIEYTPLSSTITLNDLNVKIYPNPFSGQIWIDVQNPIVSAHYSIFSIDGKLISRDILNQGIQLIQTEQFANGAYILTITDKNGKQIFNSKIVKN